MNCNLVLIASTHIWYLFVYIIEDSTSFHNIIWFGIRFVIQKIHTRGFQDVNNILKCIHDAETFLLVSIVYHDKYHCLRFKSSFILQWFLDSLQQINIEKPRISYLVSRILQLATLVSYRNCTNEAWMTCVYTCLFPSYFVFIFKNFNAWHHTRSNIRKCLPFIFSKPA